MEVECEDESGSLEDDRLVVLVLAGHVRRVGRQPAVFLFQAEKRFHFDRFIYDLISYKNKKFSEQQHDERN